MSNEDFALNPVELATELTVAWLSNPNTRATGEDVPTFLKSMHEAVSALASGETSQGGAGEEAAEEYTPAVSVRKSLASKDYLISMIDGKQYKTLRRHLTKHGMTPEQYRQRYNLKPDYPMVAERYSEARRDMAKKLGLGRKPRADKAATEAPAPKPRGRRKASEA